MKLRLKLHLEHTKNFHIGKQGLNLLDKKYADEKSKHERPRNCEDILAKKYAHEEEKWLEAAEDRKIAAEQYI